jgi:hypothetical protein
MPMRFGKALLLALVGGAATFFAWMLVFAAFSKAHWHQLDRLHDFDLSILIVFGPILVVVIFFATICLEATREKRRFENGRPPPGNGSRVLLVAALPGAVTFLLMTALVGGAWRFPLSEAAVFVVGLGLGSIWALWRRADEGAAIAWFTRPAVARAGPDRDRAS